jgi:uncharacterized protein (DUF305 family)
MHLESTSQCNARARAWLSPHYPQQGHKATPMNRKSVGAASLLALTAMLPALAFSEDNGQAAMNAFMDVNHRMMTDMGMVMSGDPDKDFVAMMIPHHQGAIDMAKVELQYGKDSKLRAMAEAIVKAQEEEIAEMKAWRQAHP